nr:MAG TPA: hypothetical protein [Caudoviricetes sp.]
MHGLNDIFCDCCEIEKENDLISRNLNTKSMMCSREWH